MPTLSYFLLPIYFARAVLKALGSRTSQLTQSENDLYAHKLFATQTRSLMVYGRRGGHRSVRDSKLSMRRTTSAEKSFEPL
jgi:hypothetical protein